MASVHRLANGVRVVCDPIPGLETTALCVVAGRGARFEDQGRSGWSHLLEHMVFKGAGDRSAMEIVEAIEAQGGQINAATGYERTSFQVRCLAGGLRLGSAVLADLVLAPRLDPHDLAREKQVVGQEIAEAADTPDDLVFEMAQAAAYGGQPLGRSILGTVESIATAAPDSLADWRRQLYDPTTLVVSAAGAVDEAELLDLAERDFGGATAPVEAACAPDAQFTGGQAVETKRLEQANLVFLLPTVGVSHPDYFVLRLFAEILGGGMASRLFQEAREKRGLAYAVDAYSETYADQGVLGVFAGCAAKDAVELAKVAAEQIAGLGGSVTAAELARAKAQIKGAMFMMRESPLARAEQTAAQLLLFDRPLPPAEIAAGIEAVSLDDLARLGADLCNSRRAAISVLGPRQATGAARAFTETMFG
ncbi:pitrilysin family protein [Phenylobacterium sp.]|uniref:M16 family metallopeptidase n=1 Tax=Phenylobacterium sp. TaxID=1871053 RepID=UPI00273038EF|nr:pitrilysin family protein [Phenylobacterium sp.]MDP1874211.1 pitrilysin family protein [Phenylobacterium sp.]MDP3298817.1 pitrilysin family protein [Phenylobacterium sp.]MDP3490819.1 pitrilysin family protein [Phenylobacterium sp.]